jgi:DNA polymerase III alpha subunit
MLQASNSTKLKNRTLWFDGDSTYPSDSIHTTFSHEHRVFVDQITKDIEQYNRIVAPDKRIQVKTELRPLEYNWTIPDEYKNLNIADYLVDKLDEEFDRQGWDFSTDVDKFKVRAVRVVKELKLFEQHELLDVLRVLIYVINTLNNQSVVWGVGRGSSVSSYVLYLIGVHDVDSIKYELDIEDFIH